MASGNDAAGGNPFAPSAIEQMSNTDIKTELRNLYAVSDFADCIEPGDLQKKLAKIRDTQLITHGLRYGPLLQIGNREAPTGVVTLTHGLGDSAYGWEDVGHMLSRQFPYLLFLLPTAPDRAVTVNGGMSMPAWYDIRTMITDGLKSGKQDGVGVLQSCDYVRSLAHTALKRHSLPLNRVVFAGFSQGAAISLATGLTSHVAPAGIAAMSGYLAAAAEVLPRIVNKATPLAMFHGRQDPVVPIAAAKETRRVLQEEAGVTAPFEFFEYNMPHSAVPEEIEELARFIKRVLPESPSSGL